MARGFRARGPLLVPVVTPPSHSVAYTNFIARTTGLDTTHLNAYADLLDGLTADGLFDVSGSTSYFDLLYIFATQDSTTATLSLVNNTFTAAPGVGVTFTADASFHGSGFIDTGFNAATASSPKFTQNSAHHSTWGRDWTGYSGNTVINIAGTPTAGFNLYPNFSGDVYLRVNDNPEAGGFTSVGTGHLLGNRSSSTGREGYRNATSLGSYGSVSSQAVINGEVVLLADGSSGLSMFSLGGSLSSVNTTLFYNRLRTYMTAVGVP